MGIKARYFLDLLLMSAIIKSLLFFLFFFNRLDTFLICLALQNAAVRCHGCPGTMVICKHARDWAQSVATQINTLD